MKLFGRGRTEAAAVREQAARENEQARLEGYVESLDAEGLERDVAGLDFGRQQRLARFVANHTESLQVAATAVALAGDIPVDFDEREPDWIVGFLWHLRNESGRKASEQYTMQAADAISGHAELSVETIGETLDRLPNQFGSGCYRERVVGKLCARSDITPESLSRFLSGIGLGEIRKTAERQAVIALMERPETSLEYIKPFFEMDRLPDSARVYAISGLLRCRTRPDDLVRFISDAKHLSQRITLVAEVSRGYYYRGKDSIPENRRLNDVALLIGCFPAEQQVALRRAAAERINNVYQKEPSQWSFNQTEDVRRIEHELTPETDLTRLIDHVA